MEKLWIECQKCGSQFWILPEEIGVFYPKTFINYQLCGRCESADKKIPKKLLVKKSNLK